MENVSRLSNPYWELMKYITILFQGANRDTLIITNTLKAILAVPVIAVLLSAIVPHAQSAFAQMTPPGNQHPDHPSSPPTDNNPPGLMVPGFSGHFGGSNPANLMNSS